MNRADAFGEGRYAEMSRMPASEQYGRSEKDYKASWGWGLAVKADLSADLTWQTRLCTRDMDSLPLLCCLALPYLFLLPRLLPLHPSHHLHPPDQRLSALQDLRHGSLYPISRRERRRYQHCKSFM
jgi:hypothetical protein